jgi:hypothetical protein
MFEAGSFRKIEAFPQKDDPTIRVFPEAKLSTAIFLFQRTTDANRGTTPFLVRSNPAARSHLDPAAQPYQDLIDQLLYRMAGLSPEESTALEARLATML